MKATFFIPNVGNGADHKFGTGSSKKNLGYGQLRNTVCTGIKISLYYFLVYTNLHTPLLPPPQSTGYISLNKKAKAKTHGNNE